MPSCCWAYSRCVANCASCHGEHQVLPSSDPRSAIHPDRLSKTCGKCHPGAGEKFALSPVHVAMATPDDRLLFGVRWVYLVLIAGTIGGIVVEPQDIVFAEFDGVLVIPHAQAEAVLIQAEEIVGAEQLEVA